MEKRWYFWVIWEWLLISLFMVCLNIWEWLFPVVIIGVASRQHALTVLAHEIAHKTVKVRDEIANYFCMWPVGLCLESYRTWHLQHHAFLGTDKDPELKELGHSNPFILLKLLQGEYTFKRILVLIVIAVYLFVVGGFLGVLLWFASIITVHWWIQLSRSKKEHYFDETGRRQTTRYIPSWWQRALLYPHYIWKHYDHHSKGRMAVPCWKLKK